MARDGKGKSQNIHEDQEEMTVVILRFKGGGETLRKGFSTVSEALSLLGPANSQRKLSAPHFEEPGAIEAETQSESDDIETDEEAGASESTEGSRTRGGRHSANPKFLNDFNLIPEGQPAWKEFAKSKQLSTTNEMYLAAAVWISRHGGQESFSIDHIFTCFRAMEWTGTKDYSQPLRQMKMSKSYFQIPAKNRWKLTQLGFNAVDELPANKAAV